MRLQIERPVILNQIASPYGLAAFGTFIFLIAWLFPPHLYSELVREPDLVFLDSETLLFFILCVAGFCVGLLLVDFLLPSSALLQTSREPVYLNRFATVLPLLVTTAMTSIAIGMLLKEYPDVLTLLFSQQGEVAKSELSEFKLGPVGWGAAMHVPVIWWTYWRLSNRKLYSADSGGVQGFFCWLILLIGVLTQIAIALLRVSRDNLMPVLGGLAILFLMGRIRRREINTSWLFFYGLSFLLSATFIFIALVLLRSESDVTVGFSSFIGYTIASYNRLPALLHGTMHYPYGGHGVYLFSGINEFDSLKSLLPAKELRWPDSFSLWASEFQGPQLAGLNSGLIWSGVFGYLYSDCGWWTPLVLVFYGLFYELSWRAAKAGAALGTTIYPWLAYSSLLWFAYNMAFDYRLPFCILAGLLLTGYERVLSLPQTAFKKVAGSLGQDYV